MKREGRGSAFTLVEMTATLLLTTLLLSAIFEVVSLLSRDAGEKGPSLRRDAAVERFLAALRKDLESAWRTRSEGGLELLTYRSLAGPPKPLLVEYEVAEGGFLIRRERDLASLSSEDSRSELVLRDVVEIEAVGLGEGSGAAAMAGGESAGSARLGTFQDMSVVPERIRLALRSPGSVEQATTSHVRIVLR